MFYTERRSELIKQLDQLKIKLEKERATWGEVVDGYKKLYEDAEKRRWELVLQRPFYKFVLGDEVTGWVWLESCENLPEIKIGSKIKLFVGNDSFKEVTVTKFYEATLNEEKMLTVKFYVEEQ